MLASVDGEHYPAKPCAFDGSRSICPEDWQMRQLYVVEATPKSTNPRFGGASTLASKRIIYVDSEGWFITASDLYDRQGQLWRTIATFSTYRDRSLPEAPTSTCPFKRVFQTALVDENVQDGGSTVVYMPAPDARDRDGWYINTDSVNLSVFEPNKMGNEGE